MRLVRICLPLLAFACSEPRQPVGDILVVAQSQTANSQITRVTVTITPADVISDLARNPDGTFSGVIVVPVGGQTVTAEAFAGSIKVGTGTASVMVTKGTHIQALVTILDTSGPAARPDHSPVVTSLVTPTAMQVDDQSAVTATAMDGDGNQLTYSWSAAPPGCGTFADGTAPSTTFTARVISTCTLTVTVTANGKSDSKAAPVQISAATGFIDVTVTYVPQPLISSMTFLAGPTQIASVARDAPDATIRTPFHKGTPYTVTLSFDAWPTNTLALSDSCALDVTQPVFPPNGTAATATWTPAVDSGACKLTATLTRPTPAGALEDTFFVVVLPVP